MISMGFDISIYHSNFILKSIVYFMLFLKTTHFLIPVYFEKEAYRVGTLKIDTTFCE